MQTRMKGKNSFSPEMKLSHFAERLPSGSRLAPDRPHVLTAAVNVLMDAKPTARRHVTFVPQEMENAWNEYSRLERDVDWLKAALQAQMTRSDLSQVRA